MRNTVYVQIDTICNNCHVFYLITAFCDDDVTCNGHGKCDNNGVCQCDDSFYAYNFSCLGNFEYLAIQEIMC